MKSIYRIRDLQCLYHQNKHVLKIDSLDIPAGKLVFIIGRSGIGKSTLLEILGLMNDPFERNLNALLQFSPETEFSTNLLSLWNTSDLICSEFRKKHYSFMFQQTNLMPNFTCGENMMISLLINGKSAASAKKIVLEVMDRLSLERSLFDKKITEISGGQRQRLSFVRAVTSDFSVLFGDEPTGNLDMISANEIMSILSELVHDQQKSCIIVSHDLQLADAFADVVIPITAEHENEVNMCGRIQSENILYRSNDLWTNSADERLNNDGSSLLDCLKKNNVLVAA
ncbi:MAG: ABC transporter ATP-binding protein [Saprospiraceae bacterium]